MPIQLERLERLLDAAEALLNRDQRLRELINRVSYQIAIGKMTLADGMDAITTQLKVTPANHPAELVIIEERTRFKLTSKRSIAERYRMRARRAGIPFYSNTSVTQSREKQPPAKPKQDLNYDPEAIQRSIDDDIATEKELDDFANQPAEPDNIPTEEEDESWKDYFPADWKSVTPKEE